MIMALAFVPIADTSQSFNALAQHCVGNEQGLLDYFGNQLYWRISPRKMERPFVSPCAVEYTSPSNIGSSSHE